MEATYKYLACLWRSKRSKTLCKSCIGYAL